MCSNWNYNGDVVLTDVTRYDDGISATEIEYGKMVNGLREGTFTSISQIANDDPYTKSWEYKDGRLVSSTDTHGVTEEENGSKFAGIKMHQLYLHMDQYTADELFW